MSKFLTYQEESFESLRHVLPSLFKRHWEEVALDKTKIKLQPDWDRYIMLDRTGYLKMLTVRHEGTLVGYHIVVIMGHLHYADSLTAFPDIYYLLPEYRGGWAGVKLFTEMMNILRALGVQKMYTMSKVHRSANGRELNTAKMLKRLGFKHVEDHYARML